MIYTRTLEEGFESPKTLRAYLVFFVKEKTIKFYTVILLTNVEVVAVVSNPQFRFHHYATAILTPL